jgi:hypothetical protein
MGELVASDDLGLRLNDSGLYGRLEHGQHALHVLIRGDGYLTGRELPAMDGRDAQEFVAFI